MVSFIENQGFFEIDTRILSKYRWSIFIFDNIQIDAGLSFNTKSAPGLFYFNSGVSYRLDFHKSFISAEEIKAKETAKQEKDLKDIKKIYKGRKKDLGKLKEKDIKCLNLKLLKLNQKMI